MASKTLTSRWFYILSMIVFLGLGLHFYLLGDDFFGFLLLFTASLNLFAFFQLPKHIGDLSIMLNFYNAIMLLISAYNYGVNEISSAMQILFLLAAFYTLLAFRLWFLKLKARKKKRKRRKKTE